MLLFIWPKIRFILVICGFFFFLFFLTKSNTSFLYFSTITVPWLLLFSGSVVSASIRFHGLQHIKLPHPSTSHGACSNSCPLSQWYHPTISSSVVPFSSHLQSFPAIRVFSNESTLCIRWPKYWRFSLSSTNHSSEYSGLISFRIDWLDLLAVQEILESSLTRQFKSIHSSALTLLYGPTLISIHDYWKNHSFDYTDLCQKNDTSAFEHAVQVCHCFFSRE